VNILILDVQIISSDQEWISQVLVICFHSKIIDYTMLLEDRESLPIRDLMETFKRCTTKTPKENEIPGWVKGIERVGVMRRPEERVERIFSPVKIHSKKPIIRETNAVGHPTTPEEFMEETFFS
jgi:hypothetical protein